MSVVGSMDIECPECFEVVPVVITAELLDGDDGGQRIVCDSDMTDLWAHYWTHSESA